MRTIANLIKRVLDNPGNENTLQQVRLVVSELCREFPIYRFLDRMEETSRS